MRIGRTLPPAAAPIGWKSFFSGIGAVFTGESACNRFSAELLDYFGKSHCFLISSGKAALTLILQALKEQYPGRDEVIIPAYTCYSVPSAIVRAGLKVKLCDIAADSFDFDFEQLSLLLKSKKLLCVVPTHLFGLPADVNRLKGIINDPDVTIVEDAAQAMGGEWQGEKLGTLGDVSFFSLGRGKAFSTVEGGIILTDNAELATNIKRRVCEISDYASFEVFKLFSYTIVLNILLYPGLFWIPRSLPFLKLGETKFDPKFKIKKMSSFQAGLTENWAEKLRFFRQVRQSNTKKWLSMLNTISCKTYLSQQNSVPDIIRLPVRIEDEKFRVEILELGVVDGTGISIAYPNALSDVAELSGMFNDNDFPSAKKHARELITLPLHPFVSNSDLDRVETRLSENSCAMVNHASGKDYQ